MSERYVVLDTETTGLDPRRDRIITIGAVAVIDGEIRLDDAYEVMLPIDYNRGSVTVHGITRDEAAGGTDEREAMEQFLAYLGDSVIVGHHIGHDIEALNCASERHFGARMPNRWIDTLDLSHRLGRTDGGHTLDDLCAEYGIVPHDRHTAGGDAFLTAQIFLRLLRIARKTGVTVVAP
jgi:DNA polymerase-3 subunit epsilon